MIGNIRNFLTVSFVRTLVTGVVMVAAMTAPIEFTWKFPIFVAQDVLFVWLDQAVWNPWVWAKAL